MTSLFAYGFRTFFLAVGASAVVLVPLWALAFSSGWTPGTAVPASLWHAHEMLFGFGAAAIAGFLLTAVPSWTGQKGFGGPPLVLMSAVWLLGRLAVGASVSWPGTGTAASWSSIAVAAVDLAFLPLLGWFLARPLIRERNRNTPLLLVLLVLFLCNGAYHVGLYRSDVELARQALLTAVNLLLILVTVIGGRITPSFTATALRQQGVDRTVRSRPRLTQAAIALMVAVAAADIALPASAAAGWIALVAAFAQGARFAQWQGLHMRRHPLVWILHLAYAWLPMGLLLKALALLVGAPIGAFWLHALTIGAIATMILGVMTRVALGHTGRPLRPHPVTVVAYWLLAAAVLVRVFGAWIPLPGFDYAAVIVTSAALWTAAFALFLRVYGPILLSPRVDGKTG